MAPPTRVAAPLLAFAVIASALAWASMPAQVALVEPSEGSPAAQPPSAAAASARARGASDMTPPLIPPMPADVNAVSRPVGQAQFRVLSGTGADLGMATWRTIANTGNCCENYITATSYGRLADLGGGNVMFSDDEGLTWKEVSYDQPWGGGEGAIVTGPDGDIISGAWNGPDSIVAMKYDTATDEWTWSVSQTHPPMLDRPWLAIAPGPFSVLDRVTPYLTIITGGSPEPRVDNWLSLDGYQYIIPADQQVDRLTQLPVEAWLDQPAKPEADWIQPTTDTSIFALPGGGALARAAVEHVNIPPSLIPFCTWRILGDDAHWHCFDTPAGLPDGRIAIDSLGRVHLLDWASGTLTYMMSSDGARTFTTATATLPASHTLEDWDFKANGGLGLTAVAVHTHSDASDKDQDLVYRFDITGGVPVLTRQYFLGLGDLDLHNSCCLDPRFDFSTLAILPSGAIVTSFADAAHHPPELALLLESP